MEKTIRLTTAQAIVKFLDQQYVAMDGEETKFVEAFFTLFGHGIAVGLGEALDTDNGGIKVMQGRNEQGMCHCAIAYAKQHDRRKIIPCASSIGPGAANMVVACATATVNNIPLLVFPSDTYASRQPDPVLQQLEQSSSLSVTTNDAFKPVVKYWDRVVRPEQLMTALINAMRVLTDPSETGAVCIALPQDVEGEAYDYPEYFFKKRVHRITRPVAPDEEIQDIADVIAASKKPIVIVGGGVRYSLAGEVMEEFCETFNIPFGESQAGKSACRSDHPHCLGGIGVTGTSASNKLAPEADCVIAVGTTSIRTLESAADGKNEISGKSGWTQIFIYPGYEFKCVDALITNFHLPESTLIMLVSALAGRENVLNAYKHAVEEEYRFFSFGDAMFITDMEN